MSDERRIQLYQTDIHPCSYIDGEDAVTVFLDPKLRLNAEATESMTELGFRRSGLHTYRPQCPNCSACISVRVNVNAFQPNRTQRKMINRNQDLEIDHSPPELTLENYRLYRRYINARHSDGDMFPPSAKQFAEFLGVDTGFTRFWNFRRKGQLLGVAVTDHYPHSLSSVYSFFEPEEQRRSLGSYFVLQQIQAAKKSGLEWFYLGYWVSECRKMSYKSRFQPQEIFTGQCWQVAQR